MCRAKNNRKLALTGADYTVHTLYECPHAGILHFLIPPLLGTKATVKWARQSKQNKNAQCLFKRVAALDDADRTSALMGSQ